MIKCEISESTIIVEEVEYLVYGLKFFKDGDDVPFRIIDDIFTEFDRIKSLRDLINGGNITENSIDQIIEDALI